MKDTTKPIMDRLKTMLSVFLVCRTRFCTNQERANANIISEAQ